MTRSDQHGQPEVWHQAAPADWHAFVETLELVTELAVTRHRLDQEAAPAAAVPGQESTAAPGRVHRFLPMAAATAAEPALPSLDHCWFDKSQQMAFWVESQVTAGEDASLKLTLQADGDGTIRSVAHRWARVVSTDGTIRLSERFDGEGMLVIELPDLPEFRSAVRRGFDVTIPEQRFTISHRSGHEAGDDPVGG